MCASAATEMTCQREENGNAKEIKSRTRRNRKLHIERDSLEFRSDGDIGNEIRNRAGGVAFSQRGGQQPDKYGHSFSSNSEARPRASGDAGADKCRNGQKSGKAIRRNAEAPQTMELSKTPIAKAILGSKEGRDRKSLLQRRFIIRFAMDEMPRETVVQSKNEDTSEAKRHAQGHAIIRKQGICTQQVAVSYAQSKRRGSVIATVVTALYEAYPRRSRGASLTITAATMQVVGRNSIDFKTWLSRRGGKKNQE